MRRSAARERGHERTGSHCRLPVADCRLKSGLATCSAPLMTRFFATREEKHIRVAAATSQDDTSFRAKRSGASNLLLVAALGHAVSIGNHAIANRQSPRALALSILLPA